MKPTTANPVLLDRLPENYGSLFDKFFNEGLTTKPRLAKFYPQADVVESEKNFQILIALPGLKKEDINLELQEGKLTISGERKFNNENKENKYHFIQTNYGHFSRVFFVPDNINEAAIEANFENGMLTVVIPKDEKKVQKRQITVK